MMIKVLAKFLLFLVLFCGMLLCATGQELDSDVQIPTNATADTDTNSPVLIQRNIVLEYSNAKFFLAKVDLGDLLPNKDYEIELEILNPTDEPFSFDKINNSCLCSKFESATNLIDKKSTTIAKANFKSPRSSLKNQFGFGVEFYDQDRRAGQIVFSGALKRNLHIQDRNVTFSIGKTPKTRNIPIEFSDPIRQDRLEIIKSKSLKDVAVSISADGKLLEITVHPENIEENYLSGEVTVKSTEFPAQASTSLLFLQESPVVVTPRLNTFTIDEKIRQFKSIAIVKFDSSVLDEQKDAEPAITAKMNGVPLGCVSRKLTRNVYRIFLTSPAPRPKDDSETQETLEIDWTISTSSQSFQISTKAIFNR